MVEVTVIQSQVLQFLKIFTWGIIILLFCGFGYYFLLFKYKVEINKETGSGIIIRRMRAKKSRDRQGIMHLKGFMSSKSFVCPNSGSFIFRDGYSFLIRFYEKGDDDVHPIVVKRKWYGNLTHKKTEEEIKQEEDYLSKKFSPMPLIANMEAFMQPIPQNIKFAYKYNQTAIDKKYEEQKNFMQQYGQMIGIGIIVIGLVMSIYFIMDHVESAIQLGNQVVSMAAQVSGKVVQSGSPP